jgi:tubulin beta
MREIVSLSIGQAGNQINKEFWKTISKEHGVDTTDGICKAEQDVQSQKLNVFFEEVQGGRCVPRSILVDLEPGVLDSVRSNKEVGSLFNPDNYVFAQNGAGNNWAKGFFNEGAEIVEDVMDRIRKQVELCDAFNSFQIMHSIGGGTGSGFGSLMIGKLNEEYSDKLNINYSIFPGSTFGGTSDVVVEPYNSIMTLNSLIESSHACFTLENKAIFNICQNNLKIKNASFDDVNYLIA